MSETRVGIVMGSDSDWPVMKEAAEALTEFDIGFEADVVSAHRMPEEMLAYGKQAADRGLSVIIAGAGGAAHLPGMLASVTPLPVIGVPVPLKHLDGLDSLLSIVQMPSGVPVATVAVGGARNAGLLAVRILAATEPDLREKMVAFQASLKASAEEKGRGRPQRLRPATPRFLMPPPGRIVGLDVARCLALLGMVAVHVLPADTAAYHLAHGRASALFAVLLGVTLAILSRGQAASAGIAVRALLIAVLGLALGELDSGLAVILTYYGLLLLLGLPFVRLKVRGLLVLAGCWVVVMPVASHLLRPHLPERSFAVPSFESLAEPWQLLSELTFTGYYPMVPWLAYLLVGLTVGRMDLASRAVQAGLAGAGLALAVVVTAVSHALARPVDLRVGEGGLHGTTPTGGHWQWLLVDSPHSATPFDLGQTIGSALVVIGGCLLLVGLTRGIAQRAVAVVFGAGTMTLTLYSLHVLLRTDLLWPPDEGTVGNYALHALVLLWIGAIFVALDRRGPLEQLVGWVSIRVRSFLAPATRPTKNARWSSRPSR